MATQMERTKRWKAHDLEGWRRSQKKWKDNNSFIIELKRRYGLTLDQYHAMNESQDFCCAICNDETKLKVDHNHTTGKVRGLLCNNCNSGIGMLKDNSVVLSNAAKYLERRAS